MKNRLFRKLTAIILTTALIFGGSFGVYADDDNKMPDRKTEQQAEQEEKKEEKAEKTENNIIYEDGSDENVDENAPAVVYEDNTVDSGTDPGASVIYEDDTEGLEDTVSDNDVFFEEDEFLEDFEDTVSDNEIEEDTVSENEIKDEPITRITADTTLADDWFIELAQDYIKDTDDRIVKTCKLTFEDMENLEFPMTVDIYDMDLMPGRDYYLLTEGNDNSIFYTLPLNTDYEYMTIKINDKLGNIAIIEKDGYIFEEQELETEFDGMVFRVSGEMPKDSRLSVGYLNNDKYEEMIEEETESAVVAAYDVSILYDGDNEYEPSDFGRVLDMSITGLDEVHEGTASVVHVTKDGEIERKTPEVDTLFSTNSVEFQMDTFSPTVIIADTRLVVEEHGVNISLLNETNHTIYHMYLERNGNEKEAFCVDMGKSARSEHQYIQYGVFVNDNIKKILDVYYDSTNNGSNQLLTYVEAQGLIWAFQKGRTSVEDMTSVLTDIQNSGGGHADTTRITNTVQAINNRTPENTYYAWKEKDNPNDYQRFITLVGEAFSPSTIEPSTDNSDVWQVGDNAYAYIDFATKTLYIEGTGDTWNMSNPDTWTDIGGGKQAQVSVFEEGRGNPSNYGKLGSIVPWTQQGTNNPAEDTPLYEYNGVKIYDYNAYIENVVVSSGITGFGNYFAAGMTSTEQVYSGASWDYIEHTPLNFAIEWGNIRYIGDYAFYNAVNLSGDVVIEDLEYIGTFAFYDTNISRLELNGNSATIGMTVVDTKYGTALKNHDFVCLFNIREPIVAGTMFRVLNISSNITKESIQNAIDIVNEQRAGHTFQLIIGEDCQKIPDSLNAGGLFTGCDANVIDLSGATSLTRIGNNAFNCAAMFTELTLPENLQELGNSAFSACHSIGTINYLAKDLAKFSVQTNSVGTLNDDKYSLLPGYSGKYLKQDLVFNIGENVQTLPPRLIPWNTKEINFNSKYVKEIPCIFAADADNLEVVNLNGDNVVEYIGVQAFYGCPKLDNFEFDTLSRLIGIDAGAFGTTGLINVVIPDTVTRIGDLAFANCENLQTLDTGTGLQEVGQLILYGDNNALTDIYYNAIEANKNNDYDILDEYGYYYNNGSSSQTKNTPYFVDGFSNSGLGHAGCFYQEQFHTTTYTSHNDSIPASSVTLHIGSTVEKIGESVFAFDDSTSVDFSAASSLTEIGKEAFAGSSIQGDLVIPDGVTKLGPWCFAVYPGESESSLDELHEDLPALWGALKINLTSLTIPETVEEIGNNAFFGRTGVADIYYNATSANLSGYNPSIGLYLGWNNPDCVLHVGSNVEYMPAYLFNTTGITEIEWGSGINIEEIHEGTFNNCCWLPSVEIPDGVSNIDWKAFNGCMVLTDITIPASVEYFIGMSAGSYSYDRVFAGLNNTIKGYDYYVDDSRSDDTITCNFDHDSDGDGINDMLTTTVNTTSIAAKRYDWAQDLRYVEGLVTDYDYSITLPASVSLDPDEDGNYTKETAISMTALSLKTPLTVTATLSDDTLENASHVPLACNITDSFGMTVAANKKSASVVVPALGEDETYEEEFSLTLSGEPTAKGNYTGGQITVTATHS